MSLQDLDTSRLDDITGGVPELNGDLVRIVLEDAETAIGRLASSLAERDASGGAAHAHQLKGLCANVGAERLADAARRIEPVIAGGDWAVAAVLFDEVLEALATLRSVTASL